MRRWVLAAVVLTLVGFEAGAQADIEGWRLRVPTATEYLAAMPEILGRCGNYEYYSYESSLWSICHIIISEIENSYSLETLAVTDYELLINAYGILAVGEDRFAPGNVWLWNQAIILAWLNENQPDLATEQELNFAHFHIIVEPRDFNGDGDNEYLLKVESAPYTNYDIIEWDQRTDYYQFIPNSLPVSSQGYAYWEQESGNLEELMFDDVNGDGLPEWLLAYGGYGYRGENFGQLYLLSWRQDGIAYIANQALPYSAPAGGGTPAITSNVGWEFVNLDDDPAREFRQIELYSDNWRCRYEEVLIFDWDQQQQIYVTPATVVHYDKTRECAMRAAEPSMWRGDYEAAALLYEYALTLPVSPILEGSAFAVEQAQYIRARLALAYLMTQQYDDADRIINSLSKESPASGLVETFITTLIENRHQKRTTLCAALYNDFERVRQISYNYQVYGDHLPSEMIVGLASRFHGVHIGDGTVPDSEKAGCNAPLLIEQQFERQPMYVTSSPIDVLMDTDFAMEHFIQSDMDGDGTQDWLIWNEALVPPIFLSNPIEQYGYSAYSVSRPTVNRPDQFTTVGIYDLPGNNGEAIYRLTNLQQTSLGMDNAPYDLASGNCTPGTEDKKLPIGVFDLWQLVDGELQRTLHMPLCESQTLQALFPEGEGAMTFQGWVSASTDQYGWDQLVPATYEWDDQQLLYRVPVSMNSTPPESGIFEQIPTPSDTLNAVEALEQFASDNTEYMDDLIYRARYASSTETGLQMLDEALANLALANSPWLNKPSIEGLLRYQRALLLREASRNTELLAEYIAIYEAAPESAWGRLARLHIERVES